MRPSAAGGVRPGGASQREAILLLALAACNAGISLRCVEAMLPQLAREFGSSVSAAASVITAFAVAYTASILLHGPLGDRFGKLRLVVFSAAVAGVASVACAFAGDVASLAGWRLMVGLFAAAPAALGMAYIGDAVPAAERQATIARFIAGSLAGQAIGPLFGGAFTDWIGWRASFAVLGAGFLCISVLLYVRTSAGWAPVAPGRVAFLGLYRTLFSRPAVRWMAFVATTETFFFWGAYVFVGVHFKAQHDIAFTLVGLILAGYGIGGLLYSASVGWLLRLLSKPDLVAAGGILGALLFCAVAVVPHWAWAIPCTIGLGVAFYLLHNTTQVYATEVAPDARGTAVAIYAGSWSLGQALGVAAVGFAGAFIDYVPLIVLFGLGWGALGVWLRYNLHRLRTAP